MTSCARLELAARGVVGAGHAGVRVGRVGAAAGLEHEPVHARQLAQHQVEAGTRSRAGPGSSTGPGTGAPRRSAAAATSCSCDARVVLHRAGAEEATRPSSRASPARGAGSAAGPRTRRARAARAARAAHARRDQARRATARRRPARLGDTTPRRPGRAELHDERLVPAGGVVAGQTRHSAITSRAASARRSMSSGRVHLGDAVERALAEARERRRRGPGRRRSRARAAPALISATVRPVPSKSTTNSLKKPSG